MSDQIDCIFNDIRPDSVKIGMVSGSNIIEAIVDRLGHHRAKNIVLIPQWYRQAAQSYCPPRQWTP